MSTISPAGVLRRFWKRASLTWILVLLEGASLVAMPRAIGWAVDGLLHQDPAGLFKLGSICLVLLIIGALRRFYDTRVYAKIYRTMAFELVERENQRGSSVSATTARANLFNEIISFFQDDVPGILLECIGVIGTLVIILLIGWKVFTACIAAILIIVIIYALSGRRILELNRGENDELEQRVDVLASQDQHATQEHLRNLMAWEIKLSDLETLNFSLIWIALAGVLLFTVWTITSSGNASFGQILSTVMYVFGLTEGLMNLPLYYQQLVRIKEIGMRLSPPSTSHEG